MSAGASHPPPPDPLSRWTDELENRLLLEIKSTYRDINWAHLGSVLRTPVFELSDSRAVLGTWSPSTRTLSLSRVLVVEHSWSAVIEVLKHEMAHQFVDEILGGEAQPHGPRFRAACARLGIDPAASGLAPAAPGVVAPQAKRVLDRVERLLRLAGSADQNEAEAAMSAARRLMLKHNIESSREPNGGYEFKHLGKVSGRVPEWERLLASLLIKHFFVDAIWAWAYRPLDGKRGRILEVCGRPENLEMAAYIHAFLSKTAERLWVAHKKRKEIKGNRDRRQFFAGVVRGFRDKLDTERTRAERSDRALIWVGDPGLDAFFDSRHPRVSHRSQGSGSVHGEAYLNGREEGRQIVVHRPVGSDGGSRGLALPAPKR